MRFPYTSGDGAELCAVTTEHFWSGVHGLERHTEKTANVTIETNVWLDLIKKATSRLAKTDARMALFRLTKTDESKALSERLHETGFKKKQDRIEYRSPIEQLPLDDGSPFQWLNMKVENWPLEKIADLLSAVAVGDPDYDPSESALGFMEGWLKDPDLTSGLHCIEVGVLEGKPAVLIMAQINPKTKWSRISYMGILPEHRGKGLGAWVHRRGFAMMRAQGGTLYHGGTHSENHAMKKLFERHGCKEYRQMEEWTYTFERGV